MRCNHWNSVAWMQLTFILIAVTCQCYATIETTSRESSSRLLWRQSDGIAMQLQKQRRMDVVLVIMTSVIWQCYATIEKNIAWIKFSIFTSFIWQCFETIETTSREALRVYNEVNHITMLCSYRNNVERK